MKSRFVHGTMVVVGWLAGAGVGFAQHTEHQGHGETPVDPKLVAACVESQQRAADLAAEVSKRLEAARQSNNAVEMRAAMDDLQRALVEIQTSLRSCDPLRPPDQADPHAGHSMGAAQQPQAVDHAAMGHEAHEATPKEPIDPVCAMKIEPMKAPKVTYLGKTYYFCSEGDRQLFLKDPMKYLKKESR